VRTCAPRTWLKIRTASMVLRTAQRALECSAYDRGNLTTPRTWTHTRGVMRRCFQCGAMTAIEGLTRVGDGEFCASCFRALLGASAPESASAASPSAVGGPAPEPRASEPPARP